MTEQEFMASDNPEAMLYVVQGPGPEQGGFPTRKISDRKLYLWCHAVAVQSGRKGLALVDWGEGRPSPQSGRNAAYYAAEWAQSVAGNIPQAAKAALLRDVIGNPFRPVTLDMDCGTRPWAEAHTLALAAHEDRLSDATHDPVRLTILADALEEAGCVDGAEAYIYTGDRTGVPTYSVQGGILAHLRGPGPHVRGCWAIDAILGLEREP